MKGVVLSGGSGSRLSPLTDAINKHCLPVGNVPMIFHPVKRLIEAGIDEILIVTGGNHPDGFITLLKNGHHLGANTLYYAFQEGSGGIAEALKLAEKFVGDEPFAVVLGDNIFTGNLKPHVDSYLELNPCVTNQAKIFLYEVEDPERFGCPVIEDGKITNIIEKPKDAPSNYAVVGIYFYPPSIFSEILDDLKPSDRGELEITDCNNYYLKRDRLLHGILDGKWTDAGTWPSYAEANRLISEQPNRSASDENQSL
jgi:glucose-1-phosphate thymidylyltransferase